jgi:hypothetical protein
MNSFPIGQENDPEKPIFHLSHLSPTAYPTVSLDELPDWNPDRTLDPLLPDQCAIRTIAN